MAPALSIAQLRDRMQAVSIAGRSAVWVPTVMGEALRAGAVHEWFGVLGGSLREWSPPVAVLTDLAARALAGAAQVVWVGWSCWPYPRFLDGRPDLLSASIFVDPPDDASRLWAMDTALRCASPVVVIGDGRKLTLAHTRRLQLAAGCGGAVCFLARPPKERQHLSAATTRWTVGHAPSSTPHARWTVACLRNKDRPSLTDGARAWVVEWSDAQGLVAVSTAVAGGADRPAAAAVG